MKHHDKNRKFGRERNARKALLRSLAYSLIMRGKITTTEAKAKELGPFVERLVTLAKGETIAGTRTILARLGNHRKETSKLVTDIAPRYKKRSGGYTRIIKLAPRKSDASKRAVIEFV